MSRTAFDLYDRTFLAKPKAALFALIALIGCVGWFIQDLKVDISADSLVLENDQDLRYYRAIQARYEPDNFLVVTYTPKEKLFQRSALDKLQNLRDELAAIARVESVVSILDVPLVQSPPTSLTGLQSHIPTLRDLKTSVAAAEKELRKSPLFVNRLVSEDGRSTAMQVNFRRDETYLKLRDERDALYVKRLEQGELSMEDQKRLTRLTNQFRNYSASLVNQEKADIATIRRIMDRYRGDAELFLGGVPMIVADMMAYVDHDVRVFGAGVLGLMAFLLGFAFRKKRWVLLPVITALAASVATMGFLGLAGWPVTVVSSNFLALLLIFILSLNIHLIVRYRELHHLHPEAEQRFLVRETVRSKAIPCLYMVLTTMVAFGSLVVSGIRPVIDFGWMMSVSLIIAFVTAFTLFPVILMLVTPKREKRHKQQDAMEGVITGIPKLLISHGKWVLGIALAVSILGGVGMTYLTVENRFIDNFSDSTEIHQGMLMIDQKLGGTTPLDVVIDAPAEFLRKNGAAEETPPAEKEGGEDEDFFAMLDAEESDEGITGSSYWFNVFMIDQVAAIHRYLDDLPETGKVLSLSSTMEVLKQINGGDLPDNLVLSVIYDNLPKPVKKAVMDPYLSEDGNQLRFAIRVFESDPNLRRQALLDRIKKDLSEKFDLAAEQVHLSGMLVLYNNMLQSLFKSQILTLGSVFLVIFVMFVALFRSLKLALVAIIPNLIPAPLVLGLMGGAGISLDIMTITIAALSVGIGVDNTIHYVHRFGQELARDGDYDAAVHRCHGSIGMALYYTTLTVAIGFSILALSKFVPTIYFGVLSAFAMLTALTANLSVLPLMLVWLKPYGRTTVQASSS